MMYSFASLSIWNEKNDQASTKKLSNKHKFYCSLASPKPGKAATTTSQPLVNGFRMQRLVLVLQQFTIVVEHAKTQTENDLLQVLKELSAALKGFKDGKSLP